LTIVLKELEPVQELEPEWVGLLDCSRASACWQFRASVRS
jgi:hypothetical protein